MILYQNIRNRSRGFTLAELLVAMAITVVLVSITVSITATALDTWRGARSEIKASRNAKVMLDTLGRDLEALVTRKGSNAEWLRAVSDQEEIGPDGEPSPNSSRIIFYTAAPDRYNGNVGSQTEDKGGDVCVVSYQLTYGDPIFGETENINAATFVLYRDLKDPDVTFDRYLGSDDLDRAFRGTGTANRSNSSNYLCENIYEMSVTFVVEYEDAQDGLTLVRVPVMGASGGANTVRDFAINGLEIQANGRAGSVYSGGRVVAVDISATVLSDAGLRILKNSPFKTREKKAQFLAKNSYQYSKSVQIPQP